MQIDRLTGDERPRPKLGKTNKYNRWVRFVELNNYATQILDYADGNFIVAPETPSNGDGLVYNSTTGTWEAAANAGAQDLESVLTEGNITGSFDIVISDSQVIKQESTNTYLDLRAYGSDGVAHLSTDGATYVESGLYLEHDDSTSKPYPAELYGYHNGVRLAGKFGNTISVGVLDEDKIIIDSSKVEVVGDTEFFNVVQFKEYTVATVPDPTLYSGGQIMVTDEVGGYTPAFSDGTNWRRMRDSVIVS